MSFLTAHAEDHGLIEFGCNSYGGLAIRDTHPAYELLEFGKNDNDDDDDKSNSCNSSFMLDDDENEINITSLLSSAQKPLIIKKNEYQDRIKDTELRFISEHNLAFLWRRHGLFPNIYGFPVPLLNTAKFYSNEIHARPFGNIRIDGPQIRHNQRNLLAGELTENNIIQLWAVNDLSDHKALLTYKLNVEVSDDDEEFENYFTCVNLKNNNCKVLQLPHEALQLRAFETKQDKNKVFVRTKRSLLLADTNEEKPCFSTIFQSRVKSFMQIPYMDDEICVVDGAGFVFLGACGSPFSRIKLNFDVEQISPTDCPRLLLLMCKKDLIEVDLRTPNNNCQSIYSLNNSSIGLNLNLLPEVGYEYIKSREELCHVNAVDVEKETIILTTTRKHLLLDRRMLNHELFSMSHSEINGSDYCLTTTPFIDPISSGQVYSFFSLSHVIRPAVSHWSIMYHPSEHLWSSLGARYKLLSPKRISDFTSYHINMPQIKNISSFPEITRAIHYQTLPNKSSSFIKKAILFRQMEGGEIWYENLIFDPLTKENNFNKNTIESENVLLFDDIMEVDNSFCLENDSNIEKKKSLPYLSKNYSYKIQSIDYINDYFEKNKGSSAEDFYCFNFNEHFVNSHSSIEKDGDLQSAISTVKMLEIFNSNTMQNVDPFSSIGIFEKVPDSEFDNIFIIKSEENKEKLLSTICLDMQNKVIDFMIGKSDN